MFVWVTAHSGTSGKVKGGEGGENVEINLKLSKSEGIRIVWREIIRECQQYWDSSTKGRHLPGVQNKIGGIKNNGNHRKHKTRHTFL